MPFQMVMCNALSGDAFIVRAGPSENPWTAVFDTGPPGTASAAIIPVLRDVGAAAIDFLAVSHIDEDHIGGAPDLIKAHLQEALSIRSVWHNSFQALTGDRKIADSDYLLGATERTAGANTQLRNREDTLALVASVNQGVELADLLVRAGLNGNPPFDRLVTSDVGGAHWDANTTVTVVAPSQNQVDALRRHWETNINQELMPQRAALNAAASLDASVTNLASLVLLLEVDGRTILFTGDARGDHIVNALRDTGLLRNGPLEVDALKVPHHGSERSCTQDLFDHVVAAHYVVSGNGRHGNPSAETARRLGRSLRGRSATVWLSHDVAGVTNQFSQYAEVVLRDDDAVGVDIEL